MTKHTELSCSFSVATKKQISVSAFLFLSLLFLCGCGTPWIVERQANPNPFLGAKQFALLPVTFTNLQVGRIAESTYLKRKDQQQQQSWQADQQALADLFARQLKRGLASAGIVLADQSPFTISPRVTRIEPGSYWNPTEVNMNVCLLDGSGNTLDEVTLNSGVPFDLLGGASSGQRIRTASGILGNDFAYYLRKRTKK
jgi:hypothetical protein